MLDNVSVYAASRGTDVYRCLTLDVKFRDLNDDLTLPPIKFGFRTSDERDTACEVLIAFADVDVPADIHCIPPGVSDCGARVEFVARSGKARGHFIVIGMWTDAFTINCINACQNGDMKLGLRRQYDRLKPQWWHFSWTDTAK